MEKIKKKSKIKRLRADHDTAWKNIIETHFESFLAHFFPKIHRDIDFARGIEIKSNELRVIVPKGKVGKRHADVLVKVFLKGDNAKSVCLFIHIEVQGPGYVAFMVRMFQYYYRIFEKYMAAGVEIISLAIFTDEVSENCSNLYHYSRWGFTHTLEIPMVKISDFKSKPELIEMQNTSKNPMAMVVKVQLKSMEVKRQNINHKFNAKRELIRELFHEGYDSRFIRSLFIFIDLAFPMPDELEKIVCDDVNKYYEEDSKMVHELGFERVLRKETVIDALREAAVELFKNGASMELVLKSIKLPKREIEKIAATVH